MNKRVSIVLAIAAMGLIWVGADAQTNIVTNGDFEGGFTADGTGDRIPNGWTKFETLSGGPTENSGITDVGNNGPTLPGSWSLYWGRSNGRLSGDWTACEQILNYDITSCASLTFAIDVWALWHDLGGSGWTVHEFEYPVTVVIYYTDTGGTQRFWQYGWYNWIDAATGPCPDHEPVPNNGVVTAQQVPNNGWMSFSFDLFSELTNPETITKIRVGGSGWDFEGMADNVQILCGIPEGWYWKPDHEDYAPSGMPDIDQKQDNWKNPFNLQWSFCGPVALSNCWWWFDSKYNVPPGVPGDANDMFPLVRDYLGNIPNPFIGWDDHDPWNVDHAMTPWFPGGAPPTTSQPFVPGPQVPGGGLTPWGELVERLAWYVDCDGRRTGNNIIGTHVDSMQAGIDRWLESETFDDGSSLADILYERTIKAPSFAEVESLVEMCEDVILLLGFWYFAPGEQEFIRGDVNEDGLVNIVDIADCLNGPPFSCDDAADVNDDGIWDPTDCDYLVAHLYSGGPPPPPPFPDCGTDPTPDALGCANYPECPYHPEQWIRVGGHYVTVAGVYSDSLLIAFSDPCVDGAEAGNPGRIGMGSLIPHTHAPWDPDSTQHNDAGNVSHDIYMVQEPSPSPGGSWSIPDYVGLAVPYEWMSIFFGQNVPDEFDTLTVEWDGESEIFTEVEYAVVISPIPVNHPPVIIQPDSLEGYVDERVTYTFDGIDPEGDSIWNEASLEIIPSCGTYSVSRISGSGTHQGTWQVDWITTGCEDSTTYKVIVDLRDDFGGTSYCTTYIHLSERNDSLWYWKPDTTDAPSGMPDFDQYQFGPPDSQGMCGPTAVANCLWWFSAVPTTVDDPGDLIRLLSDYFNTNPSGGTYVDSIQVGLERYFQDYGFALQESTYWEPDFFEMEDSLKVCQDIILLLGFWWSDDGIDWFREGGHFVTMAGVCSDSQKIAISDPARDAAEAGWPGRVRPPDHPPHAGDPFLHNDPTYVSHDIYNSILDPEFPSPGNPFWEIDYPWSAGRYTGINVPERFKAVSRPAPKDKQYYLATEVEAAIMICPKPTVERECDDNDPKECDTLWIECGNMLVPPGGGLVTVDMTIANDESLMAIVVPLSYEGSPVCCDSLLENENTLAKVFAGSRVESWSLNSISFAHQYKTVTVAAVQMAPMDACLTPGKGHFATVTLLGDSCCTVLLDTTLGPPASRVTFMECDDPSHTLFYPVVRIDTCHIDRNYPPVIGQPDFLEGYVNDSVGYEITGIDPDGDVIRDTASIDIQPGCGDYSITRISGHGTSSGSWRIVWYTDGCTPCDTHMVIHDLTDEHGATAYCTTWVHLSSGRECDDNDPKECDTLWVECGNMLVPPGGGLVTVDMTIAFDESLSAIIVPLSYQGSPICCDSMPADENTLDKVFAGSIVPSGWIKVVTIDHQAKTVLVGGVALVPPTDCLVPQKGHLGTLTLFGDSCCTILLDTTFIQGNTVGFTECGHATVFYPVVRIDTCHIDRNYPPVIGQPDFLEGYVDDLVQYDITGTDPDGDVIRDTASIDIQPGCGDYYIARISGHGTSSGTWEVRWYTDGCTPCDTHMVIHDLTDEHGATAYCTTWVHLSEEFDTTWYWKPPYDDYAPNGMPDIEQRQDGWMKSGTDQWSFCGPAAVANCFKWFDSKYNDPPGFPGDGMDQFPLVRDYLDALPPLVGYDDHDPWNVDHVGSPWGPAIGPPPATLQPFVPGPQIPGGGLPQWGELVERLAWFFDTDGIQTGYCQHTGTNVMDMQVGIQEWLESERFADAVPQFVRGDVNADGSVDLADAAACAGGGPFPCDDAADVNDDGVLDMADCVYLTNYLTAGGPAPPRPFPDCGKDPTADALGCADFPLCPWSNTLADSLCEVTTPMPSFAYVESLVHKCEDVILLLGFWFDEDPQQFVRGDVNADGYIGVDDVVALIIGPPFMCDDAADVNDDGALDDLDSAYLWDWIFYAINPPPPPFPDCGPDPTYDNLGCADFPPCPGAGEVWRRIGGHYVTVAGVNSEQFKIAFSDPFVDNAEFGAPGRVGDGTIIIPHDFPHDPKVHNDEGNVSHDIYDAEIPSISPGGEWWLPGYAINGDPGYWAWNFYAQNVPEEFETWTAPWNGIFPIHTEVEYCVHISPWDYRGDANGDGIVNVGDIVFLVSYLYKNGPPPVPISEGDVNCDGIVNVGDIVFLVSYLYRNGPVPRCCDP